MCRMFAVRASHVVDAVSDLKLAKHSLCSQCRCDMLLRDHSDGWGVVSFHGANVRLARQPEPAYEDVRFDEAIRACRSKTIVAHVRRASRGVRKLENCHPFVCGRWAFAHNGTLTAVESLRRPLLREISSQLRRKIQGETDSELIFHWLLQRLAKHRAIEGDRCVSLSRMRSAVASGIVELNQRNIESESTMPTPRPALLNTLLTNGNVMVGTRFGNSMFYLPTRKTDPTGIPRRTIAIASEPTDSRRWKEIPEGSVFSIDTRLSWKCEAMIEMNV